jgi:hypothetical protein
MRGARDILPIAELREMLSVRCDNEANSYEISPIGQDVPHLTVIVKQDVATLWYESVNKDYFVSYNPENNLDSNGWTILYYGLPNAIQDTRNTQIVAASSIRWRRNDWLHVSGGRRGASAFRHACAIGARPV